jgi:hypothetical protein
MARTSAQKRYCKKRVRQIPGPQVVQEEWEFLRRAKQKSRLTWLQLLYRGMGLRREDYLNSREFRDTVP